MQQNTITDTTVDSTAQRLPYAAPTLEQLGSEATQGAKNASSNENLTSGS
jgi:hypothetical protein